jgi:hypothetical protein
MKNFLYRVLLRFRYPVSLPEDVAGALGVEITNLISFEEFFSRLVCPSCRPTRLIKFMPRDKAEAAFHGALRKERFRHNTLFSYYFNEGWMEFVLSFDEHSRLRRIYLQHKKIPKEGGIEIQLKRND